MVGKSVSHYKIVGKIGAGGMGEIYLAEDITGWGGWRAYCASLAA